MSAQALRTYLNDHLAGSVAAIEARRLDFADLQRRAQGQYDRVDGLRLQLAPSVLSS